MVHVDSWLQREVRRQRAKYETSCERLDRLVRHLHDWLEPGQIEVRRAGQPVFGPGSWQSWRHQVTLTTGSRHRWRPARSCVEIMLFGNGPQFLVLAISNGKATHRVSLVDPRDAAWQAVKWLEHPDESLRREPGGPR